MLIVTKVSSSRYLKYVSLPEIELMANVEKVTAPIPTNPEIVITYNSTPVATPNPIPSAGDGTSFGFRHIPDDSLTRSFFIENTGTADLVLGQHGVVLVGCPHFQVDSQPSSLTIAPGAKEEFKIKFTPTIKLPVFTILSVCHNASQLPYTFVLGGAGGLEEIELTAAEELQNGDTEPTAAKGTDFGTVYARETQDTRPITIKNTGNWPLNITGIQSSNDEIFSLKFDASSPLAQGGSVQLEPCSSLKFDVVFDPATDGPTSSVISVVSSDADATPFTFSVKGEGTWLGSIKATVWYDKNANGVVDANENGMKDILVQLTNEADASANEKSLTNGAGQTKYDNLEGGEFVVTVDETTLPEGGVCTTGTLAKTLTVSEASQMSDAKFGIFYEDTTSIEEHNYTTGLPWDADLIFYEGSPDFAKEPWENVVDHDLYGWDGTATVGKDANGDVWATLEVKDGPSQFNRMTIITDDGDEDDAFHHRHVQRLEVYISTTGPDSADFVYAGTINIDNDKIWPPIYRFKQTFVAKWVKIVITLPEMGPGAWHQLTEVALGELDEVLTFSKRNADLADAIEMPTAYSLGQNYPNPFNPTTSISYSLPETQNVDIAVFNIRGDLVKQIVSGSQDAGVYNVSWNATDAAGQRVTTGVYFYRINAGSFTETKKMTLIQ
jgi:hypothetical protein